LDIPSFAHSLADRPEAEWQRLSDHLYSVSRLAGERASKFGFGPLAEITGKLHDLGKYSRQFQDYIAKKATSPDHATAGAQVLMQAVAGGSVKSVDRICAQLAAFCIAGHHSGLLDRVGETGSLNRRLQKEVPPLDMAWMQEVTIGTIGQFSPSFRWHSAPSDANKSSQLAFLGRMIFSALVDADFLDTEAFYAQAANAPVDRKWPDLRVILPDLLLRYEAEMAKKRADSDLNRLRGDILTYVRSKATLPKGVYTLNVPTGGGKTLASLGFALDHAKVHGMERIICAIPFTSIIDQTAAIFTAVLGEGVVLEHHSAIEQDNATFRDWKDDDERRQGHDKLKLAMEDWAAPVVVTTNVQLFESLFSNRPSRCRKLHALANAVLILDEAQTIPLPVLKPCVAALDELARNYGATIVLCTATQPALAAPVGGGRGFEGGFAPAPVELAPDPAGLHQALRRVTLDVRRGPINDTVLVQELADHPQALVIVNSRKHALVLYREAIAAGLDGLIHLSTRQIATHRREALADIRGRLKNGNACRVIATSLVEAGVDLDFPRVWRAEAGLDQIAQAAGRCNREGKRAIKDSVVTVFQPTEARPPAEIKAFAEAMHRVAAQHADLFSPQAITAYFEEVYWVRGPKGLDKHDVAGAFQITNLDLMFSYRTIGENFRLIESGMEPVIIPADDNARKAIEGLKGGWLKPGAAASKLQTYTVQVPPKARKALIDAGRVAFVDTAQQFAVLTDGKLYTLELGLLWEDGAVLSIVDLMM
jgi:CRISPR-associated endonuclease/helicase Cas3